MEFVNHLLERLTPSVHDQVAIYHVCMLLTAEVCHTRENHISTQLSDPVQTVLRPNLTDYHEDAGSAADFELNQISPSLQTLKYPNYGLEHLEPYFRPFHKQKPFARLMQ